MIVGVVPVDVMIRLSAALSLGGGGRGGERVEVWRGKWQYLITKAAALMLFAVTTKYLKR